MNIYSEPSVESRALARNYINKTLYKHSGPVRAQKALPASNNVATSPSRALLDQYARTFDEAHHLPTTPSSSRPNYNRVVQNSRDTVTPPFHDHPDSDSVSHYLTTKLEADQGVGERYESTSEIADIQRRIELEEARLKALRETRLQVDERTKQTERASRRSTREHSIKQHSNSRNSSSTHRIRSVSQLSASLERERQLLAKTRRESAHKTSISLSSLGASGSVSSSISGRRVSGRNTADVAKLLEEERAMLKKEREDRLTAIRTS